MHPREGKNRYYRCLVWLAIFGLGLVVGLVAERWFFQPTDEVAVIRENSKKYELINPFLLFDTDQRYAGYGALNRQIKDYVDEATTKYHLADSVSVYFRDLNSGRWTGINEEQKYQPGSMIKVMVMLVYLKMAETNPEILNQYLYYQPGPNQGQTYRPKTTLAEGYYSALELIKRMIIDSDNDALYALKKYPKVTDEMNNLDKVLEMPPFAYNDYLSPRSYSSLFRILYGGTYLWHAHSEQALRLLTATDFTAGLTAGLPKEVMVAHKFGERTDNYANGQLQDRELHDCGIIYYPQKPYFLCVMTKGKDFSDLEKVIAGLSRLVYAEVNNEK